MTRYRCFSVPLLGLLFLILFSIGSTLAQEVTIFESSAEQLPDTNPPNLLLLIAIDDTFFAETEDVQQHRFEVVRQLVTNLANDQISDHQIGILKFDVRGPGQSTNGVQPQAAWLTPETNFVNLVSIGSGYDANGAQVLQTLEAAPFANPARTFTSISSAFAFINANLAALDKTTTNTYKPVIVLVTASPMATTGLFVDTNNPANGSIPSGHIASLMEELRTQENQFNVYGSPFCAHVSPGQPFVHAAFTFGDAVRYVDPDAPASVTLPDGSQIGNLYANRWATRGMDGNPLVYPLSSDGTSRGLGSPDDEPLIFSPEEAAIRFLREVRCTLGGVEDRGEPVATGNNATSRQYEYLIPTSNAAHQITLNILNATSGRLEGDLEQTAEGLLSNSGEVKVIRRPARGWDGDLRLVVTANMAAVMPTIWYDYAVNLAALNWSPASPTTNLQPGQQITMQVGLSINGLPLNDNRIIANPIGQLRGAPDMSVLFDAFNNGIWNGQLGSSGTANSQAGEYSYSLSVGLAQPFGNLSTSQRFAVGETTTVRFANEISILFPRDSGYNEYVWDCADGTHRVDVSVSFGSQDSEINIESLASYAQVRLWFTPAPTAANGFPTNTPDPALGIATATPLPTASPVPMRWDPAITSTANAYFYAEVPCALLPPGTQSMVAAANIPDSSANGDAEKLATAAPLEFALSPSPTFTPTPTFAPTPTPRFIPTPIVDTWYGPIVDDWNAYSSEPGVRLIIVLLFGGILLYVGLWGIRQYRNSLKLRNVMLQRAENGKFEAGKPLFNGYRRDLPAQVYRQYEHDVEVFRVEPGRNPAELRITAMQQNVRINGEEVSQGYPIERDFQVKIEWTSTEGNQYAYILDDQVARARAKFRDLAR